MEADIVNNLMYLHNVFIAVRQKSRQSTLCVVIKGIEKYITNIYEARQALLKSPYPPVTADIPNSYFFPNEDRQPPKNNSIVMMLQMESSPPFTSSFNSSSSSSWSQVVKEPLLNQSHHNPFPMNLDFTSRLLHLNSMNNSNSMPDISDKRMFNNLSAMYAGGPSNGGNGAHPGNTSTNMFSTSNDNSSGYNSINYSFSSLEQPSFNGGGPGDAFDENSNLKIPPQPRKLSIDENAFSGASYGRNVAGSSRFFNMDARMIDGYQAMNSFMQAAAGERTPKMGWQGIGLSRTSPAPLDNLADLQKTMEAGKFNNMSTQLVPDFTSHRYRERLSQYNDVASILISLGLEQHIGKRVSIIQPSALYMKYELYKLFLNY